MASPRTRRLRNTLLALGTLGLGLWMGGSALCQLVQTAIFVHESVIVTGTVMDMRRKPFESWSDTLGKGHWSMPGDVSYQPTVRFTLPGGIDAIRIDMDIDNVDYATGQPISIISPPGKPGKAHINRWKFLWAPACLRLGAGSLLALIGYGLLRRLRSGHAASTPSPAPARGKGKKQPARRQSTPRSKAGSGNSKTTGHTTPRRRRQNSESPASANAGAAPKKPRHSRNKQAEPHQAELPL